jgi:hypothetical protein
MCLISSTLPAAWCKRGRHNDFGASDVAVHKPALVASQRTTTKATVSFQRCKIKIITILKP